MTVVGVRDLTVEFGHVVALQDVTLDARPGRITAVVGGDGAGKSTLLRVLAHRVRAVRGEVLTVDRERLGYQPSTSGVWATLTVDENVEFVGRSYGMSTRQIRTRSAELLERAGLAEAGGRLGRELSGGMRQKLGFVLAILHEPQVVLLDEPSTGVDPVSRVELWRLISTTATGDTVVVMATTYLDEAQRAASVLALDAGRVLAAGTPDEIIAAVPGTIARLDGTDAPSAELTPLTWRRGTERHIWLPAGVPTPPHGVAAPDFEDALVALSLAAAPAGRVARDRRSLAYRDPTSEHSEVSIRDASGGATRPAEAAPTAAPTASATAVTKRFGHHLALDGVGLEVRPGEIVGLIGANGAGKTTLLRILLGLEGADDGTVTLFGRAPDNASRRRLGYVPQGLGLYTTLSVRENVAFLSRVYGVPRPQLPPALQEVRSSLVSDIGLGRQRQLAFALALSHSPELLVLDEPTSGVDPLGRARLWDVIHTQAEAGRAVIVTTHYLQEAEQCTRLVLLASGRLIGSGTVSDLTRGTSAVLVRSEDWQRAFDALDRSRLPIMLTGRDIRVAGTSAAVVQDALAGIPATVTSVPPTLEETMVLLDRDRDHEHREGAAA
ncbi:ATP-binding cassette domain-containing protein [Humibacter sp. RRB41]|uniref:ATP-binding cassette domain-containing protein n=1 Tax=Humibacter sp. RRB41 TaxID=2919946 RepID=UPI001FAB1FD8|nr:ATP-binding cassette domain-containing protein [Humibacter sp. RRB41]